MICFFYIKKKTFLTVDSEHGGHDHLDKEMQGSMRLFRAQRNFYISGFSLFLSLVIRRLVILISDQANLQAQSEASMRQAQSATTAAKSLLAQKGEEAQNDSNEAHDKEVTLKSKMFLNKRFPSNEMILKQKLKYILSLFMLLQITELKKKISSLEDKLSIEKEDKETLKKQSENLAKEYDRLAEEHSKLQKKLTIGTGDKKDD